MVKLANRILEQRSKSKRPPLGVVQPHAISLALGEPDFPTPLPIIEAGNRAVSEGHTRYTDQHGMSSLREKIVASLPSTPLTRSWDASNILVTHGATAGLAAIMMALIEPGDKVVIPQPAYSLYADLVMLAGGEVVFANLRDDLHWDFDELATVLPGAKLMVFSNPSNPNGVIHSAQELAALGSLLEGTDTLVVSDEAYSSLTYDGHTFTSALEIPALEKRTIYVQTFSKKYCMTGWRIGYVAGDRELIAGIAQFHRTFNGSLSNSAQIAAETALKLPDEFLEPMVAEYARRQKIVVDMLGDVPGIELIHPEGAFYAFFKYHLPQSSVEVAQELADAGVIVRAESVRLFVCGGLVYK